MKGEAETILIQLFNSCANKKKLFRLQSSLKSPTLCLEVAFPLRREWISHANSNFIQTYLNVFTCLVSTLMTIIRLMDYTTTPACGMHGFNAFKNESGHELLVDVKYDNTVKLSN